MLLFVPRRFFFECRRARVGLRVLSRIKYIDPLPHVNNLSKNFPWYLKNNIFIRHLFSEQLKSLEGTDRCVGLVCDAIWLFFSFRLPDADLYLLIELSLTDKKLFLSGLLTRLVMKTSSSQIKKNIF